MVSNDLGNTGAGGPLAASSAVTIAINHLDAAPTITAPANQTMLENAPLVFSAANGNQLSVSDKDGNGAAEQVALTVSNGSLTLSGVSGLTFVGGANGSGAMTLQGTIQNINNALNGLSFAPGANYTRHS